MNRKLQILITAIFLTSTLISACGSSVNAAQTKGTPSNSTLAAGAVQINGAGATFPLPVYTEWVFAYQYVDASVTLNYQGIGSGGGKKAILDHTVDFAGSDSLLTEAEYQRGATYRCTR